MVGFAQSLANTSTMKDHKVQCIVGHQVKHYDIEHSQALTSGKVKYNKITQHNENVKPTDLLAQSHTSKKAAVIEKAPSHVSHTKI